MSDNLDLIYENFLILENSFNKTKKTINQIILMKNSNEKDQLVSDLMDSVRIELEKINKKYSGDAPKYNEGIKVRKEIINLIGKLADLEKNTKEVTDKIYLKLKDELKK